VSGSNCETDNGIERETSNIERETNNGIERETSNIERKTNSGIERETCRKIKKYKYCCSIVLRLYILVQYLREAVYCKL